MRENLPTIEQMECFIIYGRAGNFARAAREANITQSAFSAQIKHLECVLGVKLIERSPRGSHLTEEGERFLPRIRKWMEGLREIVDDTRPAAKEPAELNVGILRSLGDIQMNRHVARFRELHPNVQFNVFDMPTYQIHQAMTEGRLDVVSTYFVEKSLPDGASLEDYAIVRFCRDNMVYYGPRMDMGGATADQGGDSGAPPGTLSLQLLHEPDLYRLLYGYSQEIPDFRQAFLALCHYPLLPGK